MNFNWSCYGSNGFYTFSMLTSREFYMTKDINIIKQNFSSQQKKNQNNKIMV